MSITELKPRTQRLLDGHVDGLVGMGLRGWAIDPQRPNAALTVELLCDDQVVGSAQADLFRDDLLLAGKGTGRCAFDLALPETVFDGKPHLLSARVLGATQPLPGAVQALEVNPETGFVINLPSVTCHPTLGMRRTSAPPAPLMFQVVQLDAVRGVAGLLLCNQMVEPLPAVAVRLSGCCVGLAELSPTDSFKREGAAAADACRLYRFRLPADQLRILRDANGPPRAPSLRAELSLSWGLEGPSFHDPLPLPEQAATLLKDVAEQQAESRLDLEFYRTCYRDLAELPDAELRRHFAQFGFFEGRRPNLDSLLADHGVTLASLPQDFDWRCYLALNPDLPNAGIEDRYKAVLHYLESGRAESRTYQIDADFYAERHLGAKLDPEPERLEAMRQEAVEHWLRVGRARSLAHSFEDAMRARGIAMAGLLTRADLADVRAAHRHLGGGQFWRMLERIVSQNPPHIVQLFADDAPRSVRFYLELGKFYERSGDDARAREIYLGVEKLGASEVALEHLGNISIRAGKWTAAVQYLERSRAHQSHSPWTYLNLMQCYAAMQRHDLALERSCEMVRRHGDASDAEHRHHRAIHEYWSAQTPAMEAMASLDERVALCTEVQRVADDVLRGFEVLYSRGDHPRPANPSARCRRVLVVADQFIPQCVRYRVNQKLEQGALVNVQMTLIDWTKAGEDKAAAAVALHDVVIFYRTPGLPDVLKLMTLARQLGKPTFFEIDDLLFSQSYPQDLASYNGSIAPSEYAGLVMGMSLYRVAAAQCDFGLASTPELRRRLAPLVRSGRCHLHRNALDSHSPFLEPLNDPEHPSGLTLFYGSGTKAHKLEFMQELLPAMIDLLEEYPELNIRLMGHFDLPGDLMARFDDRLQVMPFSEQLALYHAQLAGADIAVSILADDEINDCKSEIKWLEAACFGVPMVVSPTRTHIELDGNESLMLMARGTTQWRSQLARLMHDPALRRRLGRASQQYAVEQYGLEKLGANMLEWLNDAINYTQPAAVIDRKEA